MGIESVKEMIGFIDQSPTAYHVVENMERKLREAGFHALSEGARWTLQPGGTYYVNRNGSSLIAFRIGERPGNTNSDPSCADKAEVKGWQYRIVASHTDSPVFKLKENAELCVGDKYTKLNVEGYGGMILNTWLDRPLSIAGRVIVKDGQGLPESRTVRFDKDLLVIPNVAIHMNREINDGFKYNRQVDLLPLLAGEKKEDAVRTLLAEALSVSTEDILGSDLFLYSRVPGTVWGMEEEFLSCGRLDDQECAWTSFTSLMAAEKIPSGTIAICACFDNEEVGSGTKQGAMSTFLLDVMKRTAGVLGMDEEDYLRALSRSYMISADNAHAVHPNHPEMTDANNCTYMNEGVVVKSHAGQKYTSDGMSIAILRLIAEEAGVPLQYFANRSDRPGGSTLGNLAQVQVSVNTVDIGLPQLSMHSSWETAGVKDVDHMLALLQCFFGKAELY